MKKINITRVLAVLITIWAMTATAVNAKEKDVLWVSFDGQSTIRLIWFAPAQSWPEGGWRLTDEKGRIFADKIVPMQSGALKGFTKNQVEAVQALVDAAKQVNRQNKANRELFNGILAIQAMTSFDKAKAMGLAAEVKKIPRGKTRFRLCRLSKSNTPYGKCILSDVIDTQKPTPLPDPPKEFSVVTDDGGAKLFWKPAAAKKDIPALAYVVDRICENKQFSDQFYMTKGLSWNEDQPAFIDTGVPVEQTVTYNVYSQDLFGRKSRPATQHLFVNDPLSMKPPIGLSARGKADKIELSWAHVKDASPSAYIIERAHSQTGFYELLTPDGIKGTKTGFTDRAVVADTQYWYRVRAVGSNGALGEPGTAVSVKLDSTTVPRAPRSLTADVNPARVKLNWTPPENRTVGYIIEKKAKTQKGWHRINPDLVRVPFYSDHFSVGGSGAFSYRVKAVGLNGAKGKPSSSVKVVIKSSAAPQVPVIRKIDGKNGRVHLVFDPGKIVDDSIRFSIVRDFEIRKQGRVIKSGITSSKTEFTDEDVEPGRIYWYAVAAKGRNSNKETWSEKAFVRVGYGEIPKAAAPKAVFKDQPFVHVRIRFKKISGDYLVAVQRKDRKDGPWMTIQHDLHHPREFVDAEPVKEGLSWYRIVYHTAEGLQGEPSETVELKR